MRDLFKQIVAAGPGGAALAVHKDGELVVDEWAGDWSRDDVVNVFSVGKGVVAALAHRHLTGLDRPVREWWPEFTTDCAVADLLSHRAGLPAIRRELPDGSLFDWTAMTGALAAEHPWWPPGERHGYHAVTFGWLVGEVLRRATGRTVRELVRDLGIDGLSVGLADGTPVRDVLPPEPNGSPPRMPASEITVKAFANPAEQLTPGLPNTARWRAAEIPAANVHANARALATLYGELLTSPNLPEMIEPRSEGHDEVLGSPTRFGLGFMLANPTRPFSPNPRAFGHSGSGGALAFADPDEGFAFAFTPSRTLLTAAGPDPRWTPLIEALYRRSSRR
ncbi:serine hydrolase domain-containing protein [Herbidospora sp. NBRC 101105]|uniref:serine hydrolase domain-containing protein n=1 Tax=Herbidospora sp. NBRC 101105 TaxID=3032195 RepID=UPI0024A1C8A9|nr:serine hydrolase domain-containing protein [Herbidospora sp. NBRC 101105]GLX93072.1 carboxylesterase [Herbidospora sp. NBRC 101105]